MRRSTQAWWGSVHSTTRSSAPTQAYATRLTQFRQVHSHALSSHKPLRARPAFSSRRHFGLFDASANDDDGARSYAESKVFRHRPEEVFAVVSNVEEYSKFVPWCQKSVIDERNPESPEHKYGCKLQIGFGPFSERYRANISCVPGRKVVSIAESSKLFDYLDTVWKFREVEASPDECLVDFKVEFRFRSRAHSGAVDMFFREVQQRMLTAFQERCREVYADGAGGAQQEQKRQSSGSSSSATRTMTNAGSGHEKTQSLDGADRVDSLPEATNLRDTQDHTSAVSGQKVQSATTTGATISPG